MTTKDLLFLFLTTIFTTSLFLKPAKVKKNVENGNKKRCEMMNYIKHQKHVRRRVRMAVKEIS